MNNKNNGMHLEVLINKSISLFNLQYQAFFKKGVLILLLKILIILMFKEKSSKKVKLIITDSIKVIILILKLNKQIKTHF